MTRERAFIPRHCGQPFHASGSLADLCVEPGSTSWVKRFHLGRALAHAVTGEDAAEIGDGIAPCTRGIAVIDLPPKTPALRLMDTRALGEVGYDADDDIVACSERTGTDN